MSGPIHGMKTIIPAMTAISGAYGTRKMIATTRTMPP